MSLFKNGKMLDIELGNMEESELKEYIQSNKKRKKIEVKFFYKRIKKRIRKKD